MTPAPRPSPRAALPRGVWVLGFVSLLMDVSSEMIHSLLPVFLVGTLGVSVLALGLIEGLAEATALLSRMVSGMLSDRWRRRKPLAVLGYALGALSKPAFALAGSASVVVAARVIDRIGKGIRGAPRDALVADLTPPPMRGAAYGLRQALDTVGAFVGPLVATALLLAWAGDLRAVFWVAVVPAVAAVALVALGVREPPRVAVATPAPDRALRRAALARLPVALWAVVGVGAVLTLARFSEAFLVLRAQDLGVAVAWLPLVMAAMSAVYAASAYPFGRLADALAVRAPVSGHAGLLGAGLTVLVAADLVLAAADGWPGLLAGVVLWGLHMGMTQGLLAALVAAHAPTDLRGTAFGVFNLVSGLAMLGASVVAGALWTWLGAGATFVAGAGFAALAALALGVFAWRARARARARARPAARGPRRL